MPRYLAADYLATFLADHGVTRVYTLSGGTIMHLLDALARTGAFEIVTVHHEQAAAFAVDAEGRLGRRPAVAIATSGPGAVNMLTGIASCYFDSVPALFITGQVNRSEQRGDRPIRQLGFQETDIVAMARPVAKLAKRIERADELPNALAQAFGVAVEGRPGPALIDIPMDVSRESLDVDEQIVDAVTRRGRSDLERAVRQVVDAIHQAERPMLLVGRGVLASGSEELLQRFAEALDVPTVWSLLGLGAIPTAGRNAVGMIGTYGNRWANLVIGIADPLVVLGSRLDIRQTGADTTSFKGNRRIFHVDIESGEINNRLAGCVGICASVEEFLTVGLSMLNRLSRRRDVWHAEIAGLKRRWPDTEELTGIVGINPNCFMHAISRTDLPMYIALDVGQHQMWAAQSLELGAGQRVVTSGGMGAMGYGLPAAIGAAFFSRKRVPVLCIAGDAGFQLNIQELETARRNSLPIKIVVMNNRCHGMTRQFQQTFFASRYTGTIDGYSTPDFAAVARAYGVPSRTIATAVEIPDAVADLWRDPTQLFLLEVRIDPMTNAFPKVAFGRPIWEMEPLAVPVAMEAT